MVGKVQGGDAKEGIVLIDVSYAQSEDVITAKDLGRIKKIVVPIWGYIIVSQGHERQLPVVHQFLKMPMGYSDKLDAFRAAAGLVSKILSKLGNRE